MFPWGDLVIYQEYYKKGGIIPGHAKTIVEMSGNKIVEDDWYEDDDVIEPLRTYREEFVNEEYEQSLMDGNSFASPAQERACSIGQLYNDCGLDCAPSKMPKNFSSSDPAGGAIPRLKMWLELDKNRPHIMHQFFKHKLISQELYDEWLESRRGEWRHAPKLYFVSTLKWTFEEFRTWAMNPKTNKPVDKNNHIAGGALKYIISCEPYYVDKDYIYPEEPYETRRGKFVNYS
jgi:hypothetical protein